MLRYIFLSVFALLLLTACGSNDLDKLIETKKCLGCDLSGTNLAGANLTGALMQSASLAGANLHFANLDGADLTRANLSGADLDGVIGADFTGALNVPKKYLKD